MDITPVVLSDKKIINKYGNKSFTINQEKFSSNIILTPNKVFSWNITSIYELQYEHFRIIFLEQGIPELIILGTGQKHIFLPKDLLKNLESIGRPVEIMSTKAACHTYNILVTEGREIIAGLIAV